MTLQYSRKMILAFAAIFSVQIVFTDLTQVYQQRADMLQRDVFCKLYKAFELGPDKLLKLLKPPYDWAENMDYWETTFRKYFQGDIGFLTCNTDHYLVLKHLGTDITELLARYVEEKLHEDSTQYSDKCRATRESFNCKISEWKIIQFPVLEVKKNNARYSIHQQRYITVHESLI